MFSWASCWPEGLNKTKSKKRHESSHTKKSDSDHSPEKETIQKCTRDDSEQHHIDRQKKNAHPIKPKSASWSARGPLRIFFFTFSFIPISIVNGSVMNMHLEGERASWEERRSTIKTHKDKREINEKKMNNMTRSKYLKSIVLVFAGISWSTKKFVTDSTFQGSRHKWCPWVIRLMLSWK